MRQEKSNKWRWIVRFCHPGRACGGRITGVIPFRIGKAIADAVLAGLVARQNAVSGVSSANRRKTEKNRIQLRQKA